MGRLFTEHTEKSFGSDFMANRTFGKECWRDPLFKLSSYGSPGYLACRNSLIFPANLI